MLLVGDVPGSSLVLTIAGFLTILGSMLALGSLALRKNSKPPDVIEAGSLVALGFGGALACWQTAWGSSALWLLSILALALLIAALWWAGQHQPDEQSGLYRWIESKGGLLAVSRTANENDRENDPAGDQKSKKQGESPKQQDVLRDDT